MGSTGPVQVVLTVVKRKELGRVIALIKSFDSGVFYSVDDLHSAGSGFFPRNAAPFPNCSGGVGRRETPVIRLPD